jgi:hypothetical protein
LLTVGVEGIGLTITEIDEGFDVHPLLVAVTLYVPELLIELPVKLGFCEFDVKPLGPVQEYIGLVYVPLADKLIVFPKQTLMLFPTVGFGGKALPDTLVVDGLKEQLVVDTVTV